MCIYILLTDQLIELQLTDSLTDIKILNKKENNFTLAIRATCIRTVFLCHTNTECVAIFIGVVFCLHFALQVVDSLLGCPVLQNKSLFCVLFV